MGVRVSWLVAGVVVASVPMLGLGAAWWATTRAESERIAWAEREATRASALQGAIDAHAAALERFNAARGTLLALGADGLASDGERDAAGEAVEQAQADADAAHANAMALAVPELVPPGATPPAWATWAALGGLGLGLAGIVALGGLAGVLDAKGGPRGSLPAGAGAAAGAAGA
jgi:hypothetical protein